MKLRCFWGNSKWERVNVGCLGHEAKTTKKVGVAWTSTALIFIIKKHVQHPWP